MAGGIRGDEQDAGVLGGELPDAMAGLRPWGTTRQKPRRVRPYSPGKLGHDMSCPYGGALTCFVERPNMPRNTH